MGSLIDGLGDHIEAELNRLRDELRIAIAESGYTLEQVASLADVSFTALRNMLHGRAVSNADTLIRVGFVVGARIELARGEGEGARPFQVVPTDPSSTGLSDSSKSTRSRRDQALRRSSAASKKATKQRKGSAPRKRDTQGWAAEAA